MANQRIVYALNLRRACTIVNVNHHEKVGVSTIVWIQPSAINTGHESYDGEYIVHTAKPAKTYMYNETLISV